MMLYVKILQVSPPRHNAWYGLQMGWTPSSLPPPELSSDRALGLTSRGENTKARTRVGYLNTGAGTWLVELLPPCSSRNLPPRIEPKRQRKKFCKRTDTYGAERSRGAAKGRSKAREETRNASNKVVQGHQYNSQNNNPKLRPL